jgi:hypothetical protein
MIEDRDPSNTLNTSDTVCIIQVTTTKTFQNNNWGWYDVKVIADSVIRYGDFENIGQIQSFKLPYNLGNIPSEYFQKEIISRPLTYEDLEVQRTGVGCIEFKVIWKGNPQLVRLSVDKIIVSDQRGRALMFTQEPVNEICSQILENRSDFSIKRIAGWIGLDEPWALDFWAPIKKFRK